MLNVGLTGGIASGKSTVDMMFHEKGAYLIDHDVLAHQAEEPDRRAWREIVAFFGPEILNDDRTINRRLLGSIVFKDREKRRILMDIVHPIVFEDWKRRVTDITRKDPSAIIISDIPLLLERGWQDAVDSIILIYVSPEEQIGRLITRNGLSRVEAEERLSSQIPIDEKVLYADFIINNEGPLDETRKEVDRVWVKLLDLEKAKRLKGNHSKLRIKRR
ncbi:MAG TPA: dephospho-CoA kinase [Syntrophales bacterium]|nr:dephospho-CoA kinase [Syntrophales bacterium]